MLIAANNKNVVSVILDNTKPKLLPKLIQSKHNPNPNPNITTSNTVAEHKCSYEYVLFIFLI